MKEKVQEYFQLQKSLYEYFGYVEDWKVYPLDDQTDAYWFLDEEKGFVAFHEEYLDQELINSGLFYSNDLMTDRFLSQSNQGPIWRGEELTLVLVDTRTDGNKFLTIFSNDKEIKDKSLEFGEWR